MAFQPYLFFGGNCREAFTRYQEIFGGEVFIMTMADAPDQGANPMGPPDTVIHAALKIGDDLLMASDDPMNVPFPPVQGMMVTFSTDDEAEANRVYAALAEGGAKTQDITQTFFSPAWGMVTDRFGTPWMVSTNQEM